MALHRISPQAYWAEAERYDTLIDARSPAEFALDHLPGAVNWPVLDDEERRVVGTEYKQVSALEARKHGAALVARRIAGLLEAHVGDKPRDWQPVVYCWRGGQRSGTLAWFLAQIGFRTQVLDGGYKAFRQQVRDELQGFSRSLRWVVLGGQTGSGKSRLLQHLAAHGAQVLDLEALAKHRGSVLGAWPDTPQPSQKAFDTALWQALRGLDAQQPVFVESESAKIGQVQVPEDLLASIRQRSQLLRLQVPLEARLKLLLEEYGHFAQYPERFCQLLGSMVEMHGHARVAQWQDQARRGQWEAVFGELMQLHYDPLYQRSTARNFNAAEAESLDLPDLQAATLDRAAVQLVQRWT